MPRRKTHEEFIAELTRKVGNEYTVLSNYINSQTKIYVKHNTCGTIYDVVPNSILRGSGCPSCFGTFKKSQDTFVEEVFSLVGDEYKVLSNYIDAKTPVDFEHHCGYRISRTPDYFLRKERCCPNCDGTKDSWDDDKYKEFVHIEGRGEYKVLSDYSGMNNPVRLKHVNCGHIYESSARVFREGGRCPKCKNDFVPWNKLTHEEFLSKLTKEQLDSFVVLTEYKSSYEPIKVLCKECNRDRYPLPSNLLKGTGCCYRCGIHKATETKRENFKLNFLSEVSKDHNYQVLSDCTNRYTKVKFKHLKCGFEYETAPHNFMAGSRCPKCSSSKGEMRIQNFLESKFDIVFKREFTFDDLVYKNKLRFDFAILDNNNYPKLLIEFDGKHHYQEIEYFKSNLKEIKKRDELKNQYCKERNIRLIRIPYYEFDSIEDLLRNEVS